VGIRVLAVATKWPQRGWNALCLSPPSSSVVHLGLAVKITRSNSFPAKIRYGGFHKTKRTCFHLLCAHLLPCFFAAYCNCYDRSLPPNWLIKGLLLGYAGCETPLSQQREHFCAVGYFIHVHTELNTTTHSIRHLLRPYPWRPTSIGTPTAPALWQRT